MKYLTPRDVEQALEKGSLVLSKDRNTTENTGRAAVLVLAGTLNSIIRHTGTLEEQIKVVAGMRRAELGYSIQNRPVTDEEAAEIDLLAKLGDLWSSKGLVDQPKVAAEPPAKSWSWSDYAVLLGAGLALIAMAPVAAAAFLGWISMWRDTIGWPLR